MAQVTAKKIILKNNNGEYLIPYTVPYTAGAGISIENNVISATDGTSDSYSKDEVNELVNSKQDKLTAGTNLKIVDGVIKEFVPMTTLSGSGTKALSTNCVYSYNNPTGTVTFSLPTSVDTDEFNQILVQLNMSTVRTINVGTTYFFNKTAPDLSEAGMYDLVWEYDKANSRWICGLMSKGV